MDQRRGRGDAARQGLCRHSREGNTRVDAGPVAMTACIFEPHILQDLGLHLDMELRALDIVSGETDDPAALCMPPWENVTSCMAPALAGSSKSR